MTETKFTPGPWHVEGIFVFPAGYRSNPICSVSRYLGQDSGQITANARLIAAAPELLEAAKRLSEVCDAVWIKASEGEMKMLGDAWREMDAAIAKAEGR